MRPHQARLVTACQQLLALGAVLAILTPAAGIVSLDVVGQVPQQPSTLDPVGPAASAQLSSATVPTTTVDPVVTEVPLTTATGAARPLARSVAGGTATRVVSQPQPVEGFGTVGVTWAAGEELDEEQIGFRVRTRTGEQWSEWTELEFHDDHGPDPRSPEALQARPGTDPLILGAVDEVQVEAAADEALPHDLSLAVIEPGEPVDSETATPEIGTPPADPARDPSASPEDGLVLRAGSAPRPTIFSRAQWGADEKLRDKSSLRYGTVNAGFVHHTVNGNDYSEADVPGILRSIYAYHTRSRGWSDIGYNFLVDKFGRIWEGRFGGVDKPVVGAHTLGYNEYSFAMSAIGNFETVQPRDVMLRAYGSLFAWKLGLHGVDPLSKRQKVGRSTFQAINGHRDAGSTACPGRHLYAQLPAIRSYAASQQTVPWEGRSVDSNLMGTPHPDLVVRRASDERGFIIPTGGLTKFAGPKVVGERGWSRKGAAVASPDLTGDGRPDLVMATARGVVKIRPGKASGSFGKPVRTVLVTRDHDLLAAPGDLTGDGRPDLVARSGDALVLFKGTRKGGFARRVVAKGLGGYTRLMAAGDLDADGHRDVLGIDDRSRLWFHAGTGRARLAPRVAVRGDWSRWVELVGGVDLTTDGLPDLLAKDARGKLFVLAGRGDLSFVGPVGPARKLRRLSGFSTAGQLVGDPAADLVAIRGDSLVVVRNKGGFELGRPVDTGMRFRNVNLVVNAGDFDRDGFGDVLTRNDWGVLRLYRGNGTGRLAAPVIIGKGFSKVDGLAVVGDVTGDGRPDLFGTPTDGTPMVYPGAGTGKVESPVPATAQAQARQPVAEDTSGIDRSRYDWVIGVTSVRLSGHPDVLVRRRGTGDLFLLPGSPTGVGAPRFLGEGLDDYDVGG